MRKVVLQSMGIEIALLAATFALLQYPGPVRIVSERLDEPSHSLTAIFVGDVMLDRTIRTVLEWQGVHAVFGHIAPSLTSVDFVAGNLEGPITHFASQSVGTSVGEEGNTRFTFDPLVADVLHEVGFKLFSLGNNHIADFGREGIAETKARLRAADIAYLGDPFDRSEEPIIEEVKGIRLAFVSYNEFIQPDPEATRAAIGRARELGADFVVVMAHWGIEYQSAPPSYVRVLARKFSLAGADLVIGTHPHVIGEMEDIGTTRVYYSLGNFVFDQYWDELVRCGLAVELSLTKVGATTTAFYVEQEVGLLRSGASVLGCSS